MSLSFPTSPVVGQVFQSWKWSGSSWDPATQAPVINYQVSAYLAAGAFSFTTPPDSTLATVYRIRMVGGGGGGGGNGSGTGNYGASSGGAGEYKELIVTGQASGTAWPITIGAAGARGLTTGASGTNGGAGGATSVTIGGSAFVANAGGGGTSGGALPTVNGGAGGIGGATPAVSGVSLVIDVPGQYGCVGNPQVPTGAGGSGLFGSGGTVTAYSAGGSTANSGTGNGSGGMGAFQLSTQGGLGTPGAVIIERIAG